MVTPSRGGGGVVKFLINFATLDIKKYGCRLLMSTEQIPHEELNLKPSDSTLPCSTTEPQRL